MSDATLKIGMFVIAWKSKITGFSGKGYRPLTLETARSECDRRDAKFPHLIHWPEAIHASAAEEPQ